MIDLTSQSGEGSCSFTGMVFLRNIPTCAEYTQMFRDVTRIQVPLLRISRFSIRFTNSVLACNRVFSIFQAVSFSDFVIILANQKHMSQALLYYYYYLLLSSSYIAHFFSEVPLNLSNHRFLSPVCFRNVYGGND